MSQCSRAASTPNSLIAAAPAEPMISSSCGAAASSARAIRSSLSRCGSMPYASSTAIAAAHSSTRTSGAGAVSRFATSASITSPWEIQATSRTGHSSSTISAIRSRRPNSATTGSAPSRFSSTRTTAIPAPGQSSTSRSYQHQLPDQTTSSTPVIKPLPIRAHGQQSAHRTQTRDVDPSTSHTTPCAKDGASRSRLSDDTEQVDAGRGERGAVPDLRAVGVELVKANEADFIGVGSLQVTAEADTGKTAQDGVAGVEALDREQVPCAVKALGVADVHDPVPLRLAEGKDLARTPVLGWSEHGDIYLDLGPVGGVRDDPSAHLARQTAEHLRAGRDRVVATDRLEVRSRHLGQEAGSGVAPHRGSVTDLEPGPVTAHD